MDNEKNIEDKPDIKPAADFHDEKKSRSDKVKKNRIRGGIIYLRELSIVIAGIAITFMVSSWISNIKEQRIIDKQLKAVKTELTENLRPLSLAFDYFDGAARLANYLFGTKTDDIDRDSLSLLDYLHPMNSSLSSFLLSFIYYNSAFEVLKNSGNIYSIPDGNISMAIIECYNEMAERKKNIDDYFNMKRIIMFDDLGKYNMDKRDNEEYTLLDPNMINTRNFLAVYYNLEIGLADLIAKIERTIELIP